jgi:hypothetical protein
VIRDLGEKTEQFHGSQRHIDPGDVGARADRTVDRKALFGDNSLGADQDHRVGARSEFTSPKIKHQKGAWVPIREPGSQEAPNFSL